MPYNKLWEKSTRNYNYQSLQDDWMKWNFSYFALDYIVNAHTPTMGGNIEYPVQTLQPNILVISGTGTSRHFSKWIQFQKLMIQLCFASFGSYPFTAKYIYPYINTYDIFQFDSSWLAYFSHDLISHFFSFQCILPPAC